MDPEQSLPSEKLQERAPFARKGPDTNRKGLQVNCPDPPARASVKQSRSGVSFLNNNYNNNNKNNNNNNNNNNKNHKQIKMKIK